MRSSPSEGVRRLGGVALFIACLEASTLIYQSITPLTAVPAIPSSVARPIDQGVRLLSRAVRPYDGATFCEPLRGYIPNLIHLSDGGLPVAQSPSGRVIVCMKGAVDEAPALAKAQEDGLTWVREIRGTPFVIFARDEAHFRSVVTSAGNADLVASLAEATPPHDAP